MAGRIEVPVLTVFVLTVLAKGLVNRRLGSTLRLPRPVARYLTLAAGLALLSFVVLPWDMTLARWFADGHLPGDVRKLLTVSETFAHGAGVALILISMYLLDRPHRRQVFEVAAGAYGAGLVAQLLKLVARRIRPQDLDLFGSINESWVAWSDKQLSLSDAFRHGAYSFPSGHAATATGLALGLSVVYPQARGWFAVLAILASLQRLEAGAHFASDTLAGAACGALVVGLMQFRAAKRKCLAERPVGG